MGASYRLGFGGLRGLGFRAAELMLQAAYPFEETE